MNLRGNVQLECMNSLSTDTLNKRKPSELWIIIAFSSGEKNIAFCQEIIVS